jgi:hypothetical protein
MNEQAVKDYVDARSAWLCGPDRGRPESRFYGRYDRLWFLLTHEERVAVGRLIGPPWVAGPRPSGTVTP